jgi:hypothetical protein
MNKIEFRLRWIARIWSIVIIAFVLIMLIGYAVNWVKTGTADSHAMKDYPAIENMIPLTLILSVLGLGIAWRWEGLGGAINISFYLANLAVHFWMISPRPYPYPIAIAILTPGILFLVCWWISRKA